MGRDDCPPVVAAHPPSWGRCRGCRAQATESGDASRGYTDKKKVEFVIAIPPLPSLSIKGMRIPLPIVQGGMGVGVSLHPLASAVATAGGLGLLSSACLDRMVGARVGRKVGTSEAVRLEVSAAKAGGGFAGINIMVALQRDYEASVRAAIDAGADAIVSGAGLPLSLPAIQPPGDTALIPIVSSARALALICRRWERQHYRPDAVVLEGPLAGGHLGFRADQIDLEANTLERLLPPVKEVAQAHGDFPVIVAGGVYTHEDIRRFFALGADGVQMGTRFLATHESSASGAHKAAVLRAHSEDVLVANDPGSPCGLPFRVLRDSPMYRSALARRRALCAPQGCAGALHAVPRQGGQRALLLHLQRSLQRRGVRRRYRGASLHGGYHRREGRPHPLRA
jgi:nitronate monooxygenase